MTYPEYPDYGTLARNVVAYSQLKHEYGAQGIEPILAQTQAALESAIEALKALPDDPELAKLEPNELSAIQQLRPDGPRRQWPALDEAVYRDRLEGALLGRLAGNTLGAPVEFWPVEKMEALAEENGDAWPPTDYWTYVPEPAKLSHGISPRWAYTRDRMDGVPVDDDIGYTLLGLLVLENDGPDFTIEDVGTAWVKHLPSGGTAEGIALNNLRAGVPARLAGETENPFRDWIGADIRSDPWGYLAPGWPERAADMAYRDAYISHRRQGIYGEMFFSAAIAAAFALDDPVEALEVGLTEIPAECALTKAVHWALKVAPDIKDYRQARDAVDEQFKGMSPVHAINNACLTIWGITIGGTDLTKVISETVAMGMDNDCTAATAGSIVGAIVGRDGIPAHWTKNFNDTIHCWLIDEPLFTVSGVIDRFTSQAKRVFG